MKTVAIVACSNGQKEEYRSQNEELARYLEETGHKVLWSNDIYEKNAAFSGTGAERAAELMRFFNDPEVEEIYDISGGDLANQVLDGLDYAAIRRSRAVFWGYSDLTTVINAIYAQTGKSSVYSRRQQRLPSSPPAQSEPAGQTAPHGSQISVAAPLFPLPRPCS